MAVFRTLSPSSGAGPGAGKLITNGTLVPPDGPTERLGGAAPRKPPRRKRKINILPLAIAGLAFNLAVVGGLLAFRIFMVHPQAPQPATPGAASPGQGGYTVSYAQEPLKVQVGCSAVLYVDLDEPRTNADAKVSDLRYDSSCGNQAPRLTLGPGAASGAQVTGPDIDATGCADAIRTSPLGPGASVEVKKGVVLCVLTAATPPLMSLVEITDVGPTGMASMRATSWKVTG